MAGEEEFYSAYPRVAKEVKIGPPFLTKYERTRIIGVRALQLSYGAPPLVDPRAVGSASPLDIAKYEVDNGLLPVSVYRYTGKGRYQAIPLRTLVELGRKLLGKLPY